MDFLCLYNPGFAWCKVFRNKNLGKALMEMKGWPDKKHTSCLDDISNIFFATNSWDKEAIGLALQAREMNHMLVQIPDSKTILLS